MNTRMEGKVVLVTGGASGLGRAACRLFVSEGARVVVADLNTEAATELVAELGPEARFVRCDVLEEDQVVAAIAEAMHSFGALDVLYHSAGAIGDKGTVETISVDGWDATQSLLLRSAMLVVKHATPAMKQQGSGSIILTSSTAAIISLAEYSAVKLAQHGIRVNTIVPGSIPSPIWGGLLEGSSGGDGPAFDMAAFAEMQPLPRVGKPEDVAQAALFLASDASAFVTGATLPVDGGQSLYRPPGGTGAAAMQALSSQGRES